MYYKPNWFIPSIIFFSTLAPSYGDFNRFKNFIVRGCWWFMPVILATQEAEIRRITV
jgi:ABC-type polysaccharide/polyol phosphate export permease